jgi:hypothetical protein
MATSAAHLASWNTAAPWSTSQNALVKQDAKLVRDSSLQVRFAQVTFNAEGVEASGRFFSRQITYPGGESGVTLGRGYDMGRRSAATIVRELSLAGVSEADAAMFSKAAGLRGQAAQHFVGANRGHFPTLGLEAQKKLFEDVVTPDLVADIQRIFNKPDTVRAYGRPDWEQLSRGAQELVFDLRYRGDYTPVTRQRIQKLLVNNDYEGLKTVMNDTAYWAKLGVPAGRIKERQAMAELL